MHRPRSLACCRIRQVERRLAQVEAGGGAQSAQEAVGAVGKPKGRTSLRREYPELVTLEPADDDEQVFGPAWPLIVEWRGLKDTHPNQGSSLSWLVTEERCLSVELALLEEHGMTLPPESVELALLEEHGMTLPPEQHDEWAVGRRYLTPTVLTFNEALAEAEPAEATAA